MPQSHASVLLHLVFSTANRAPLIPAEVKPELHRYLGGTAKDLGCPVICVGGTQDHVHMLVRLGRTVAVSELLQKVKSNSSAWMKPHSPGFAWQAGYGAFSFGEERLGALIHYVDTQEEHHRKVSFQEEYLNILREHGLEWDERYVWD